MPELGSKSTIFKGCNPSLFTENPTPDDQIPTSQIGSGSNPGGAILSNLFTGLFLIP